MNKSPSKEKEQLIYISLKVVKRIDSLNEESINAISKILVKYIPR